MKTTIENDKIIIDDPTDVFKKYIIEQLSYTDKAKEYRIRKMESNVFSRNSPLLKKLKNEVKGCLVVEHQNGSLEIPSGFYHLLPSSNVEDKRKDTGANISLPWVNKPHDPRDYQEEAISFMQNNFRGLINLATGLGKTLTAIHYIRRLKKKTLIICPGKAIADNFYNELVSAFGDNKVGYFGDGKKHIKDITVGIVGSINNSIDKFKKQDLGVVIFDECFPYRTAINTENGIKEIGWLVKQWEEGKPIPRVLSFNEQSKQFEYKKITHGWRRERTDLIQIKYSNRKIECTPEHKLLTTNGWKAAKDIVKGDLLLGKVGQKLEQHVVPIFNKDQNQIVIGSLLGGCGLKKVGINRVRMSNTYGINQKDYTIWKTNTINGTYKYVEKNGYAQKPGIRIVSKAFDFDLNYCGPKSSLPQSLIDKIDIKALAIWYMDNGSMGPNGISAKLATCSFDKDTVDRLVIKLRSFGVDCKTKFIKYCDVRAPGYYEIVINSSGYDTLSTLIAPYIHPSMSYKIYNKQCGTYIWDGTKSDIGTGLVESVKNIKNRIRKGRKPYVFDIEVEDNHNFIVCSASGDAGIIAHNCHHLAADTFFTIYKELGCVGRMFGLTATDFRSDGKDIMITAGVGDVLIKRDLIWGIENKWLADPYFIVRDIETTGKEYPGDKLKNYREHILKQKSVNDQIISDIQKFLTAGKSVLCLVDQVEHGKMISAAVGLSFATGEDKSSKAYIDQLNQGKIAGLIGTDSLIGEGCDTRNVDVLVLANFVASKGPLIQCLGRGLRKQGVKTAVFILDYCPKGSDMMTRHFKQRVKWYKEISSNIKEV